MSTFKTVRCQLWAFATVVAGCASIAPLPSKVSAEWLNGLCSMKESSFSGHGRPGEWKNPTGDEANEGYWMVMIVDPTQTGDASEVGDFVPNTRGGPVDFYLSTDGYRKLVSCQKFTDVLDYKSKKCGGCLKIQRRWVDPAE